MKTGWKEGKYGWLISGILWGLFMFIIMAFIDPWLNDEVIEPKGILRSAVVWTIGGIAFALWMKWSNDRAVKRLNKDSEKKD
ncbi:MAG TPA: hypothetical protein DCR04_02050 [Flavobacteriales bacterium]|nr:hypothetical protein [Flavobacteriales bacterium]HAP68504.1 hypothetical protein [Flavobacteriales bacterium]